MRLTLQAWWCICTQRNEGTSQRCVKCDRPRVERHAQIHQSDRAVVYYNPMTGEHRTPPRSDMPMPEAYAQQGFERREIMSMTSWERESGSIHEASNFNSGNNLTPVEPEMTLPSQIPEVREAIAQDVREAIASGPWTGHERIKSLSDGTEP